MSCVRQIKRKMYVYFWSITTIVMWMLYMKNLYHSLGQGAMSDFMFLTCDLGWHYYLFFEIWTRSFFVCRVLRVILLVKNLQNILFFSMHSVLLMMSQSNYISRNELIFLAVKIETFNRDNLDNNILSVHKAPLVLLEPRCLKSFFGIDLSKEVRGSDVFPLATKYTL